MDILKMVKFARVWKSVSETAADEANVNMRQSLVAAFAGANVSRDSAGRFSELRAPTDNSKLMAWLRKLNPRAQGELSQNWEPFQAPMIGALGTNPVIRVEIKPSEWSRVTMDEKTADMVTEAIVDALTIDTSWIEPIVNDVAYNDSFYTYGKAVG